MSVCAITSTLRRFLKLVSIFFGVSRHPPPPPPSPLPPLTSGLQSFFAVFSGADVAAPLPFGPSDHEPGGAGGGFDCHAPVHGHEEHTAGQVPLYALLHHGGDEPANAHDGERLPPFHFCINFCWGWEEGVEADDLVTIVVVVMVMVVVVVVFVVVVVVVVVVIVVGVAVAVAVAVTVMVAGAGERGRLRLRLRSRWSCSCSCSWWWWWWWRWWWW